LYFQKNAAYFFETPSQTSIFLKMLPASYLKLEVSYFSFYLRGRSTLMDPDIDPTTPTQSGSETQPNRHEALPPISQQHF
jgi:hypothetical protein